MNRVMELCDHIKQFIIHTTTQHSVSLIIFVSLDYTYRYISLYQPVHYNDLAILLQEHSPSAVCLQESNLKPNTNISFKNYSIINCFGPANNERACWGVSILVKDGTPHQQITLNTNLQAKDDMLCLFTPKPLSKCCGIEAAGKTIAQTLLATGRF